MDTLCSDTSLQNRIKESLSAIEGYRISDKAFSLVAIGKGNGPRFRVTQDEISRIADFGSGEAE